MTDIKALLKVILIKAIPRVRPKPPRGLQEKFLPRQAGTECLPEVREAI